MQQPEAGSTDQRVLLAGVLLLFAVIWLEPRGSFLAEPDETRYAEVPREMLAAGDFAVPRLNGLPYFEKPPLLYWVNAASLRVFGETPWAARLPTRLAGLGSTLLVIFAAARGRGLRVGLSAGAFFLAAPMGFLFSRTNLTDGLLTFFLTATLLAGRAAILRREAGTPWTTMAALTGAAAAGGFLSKGLIALALPGAILLIWSLATGRFPGLLRTLVISPAPLVFLGLAAPWFLLVDSRHPGFLQFFFIHEHFQRFAADTAKRPGPIYYFVPVFLLGFLPGVPFFVSGVRKAWRRDADGFFFLVWFAVVFGFFSLSQSKLPPYLFPAIPAAAVLAATGLVASGSRQPWLWIAQALLATALAASVLFVPTLRAEAARVELVGIVAPALAGLVLASWAAVLFARRSFPLALAAVAAGWAAFFAAVAFGWPKMPQATFTTELARAARAAAAPRRAAIVGYKDYLNGVSWELKAAIPVAAYRGELEPQFETRSDVRESLVWPEEKFWALWRSRRPIVALVRMKDLVEMMTASPPARVVRYAENHAVVANFPD
jgi:4-amino-4-deoxy-L-arabinose transferase-like glycosyltransferase